MRCILSFVLIFVLLTGCAAENTAAGAAVETASADATVGTAAADTTVGTASADATVGTAAPASDLREDSSDWKLSDFVPALCEAEAEEERYFIAEGTTLQPVVDGYLKICLTSNNGVFVGFLFLALGAFVEQYRLYERSSLIRILICNDLQSRG